jgi:hypothetical protein
MEAFNKPNINIHGGGEMSFSASILSTVTD